MGSRWRLLACLAAVAPAAVAGASPAAAGVWSAPVTLDQGVPSVADAAIDPDGTAVVAWTAAGAPVRAALRSGGAAFGPTVTLAPDGGQEVAVALDGRGGALVAWARSGTLGLAERTAASPALAEVQSSIGGVAYGPDVAFTTPGEAIVVWTDTDGAVHALSRRLGGATAPLPDLAPGPGNQDAIVDADGGTAVAAWANVATSGSQSTTLVRASTMAPGGSFGAPEDVATASSDTSNWSGSQLAARRVVVAGNGSADLLITELGFMGMPGETVATGRVATRTMGAWGPAERLGGTDMAIAAGRFVVDIASGAAGDALYVQGAKGASPVMSFTARLRSATAAAYSEVSALDTGTPGELRATGLTPGRFLVLSRSGTDLSSRAGSPATEFGDPLPFSEIRGAGVLGLAGAPSGLAAGLWVTTSGSVQAAIYDDSLAPEAASRDTTAPRLTQLAVSPKRFTARDRARLRWRLSEPARVRMKVERARPGFRRGGRCVARRPRTGRVRRCTRFPDVGAFTRAGVQGRTSVRFHRFVRRHDLRPGRYRVTAVPRDAAGNRGTAKRARFRLVSAAR
jgi:hypothetical protein